MADSVFPPVCRRFSLPFLLSFFLLLSFFFVYFQFLFFLFLCLSIPFCLASGQRRYICLPFPVRLGLLIIHSRANIPTYEPRSCNATSQPEDPIFLTVAVVCVPASRVPLVKKRDDHAISPVFHANGRRQLSCVISIFCLPFSLSLSFFPLFFLSLVLSFYNDDDISIVGSRFFLDFFELFCLATNQLGKPISFRFVSRSEKVEFLWGWFKLLEGCGIRMNVQGVSDKRKCLIYRCME